MQNYVENMWCSLFLLDEKNPFCANLVKKIKIISLKRNLVPRLTWICEIQWWCSLFLFLTIISFMGKFDLKIHNCLLKVKFDTKTNLNMRNSMVVSILSVLDWKWLHFLGKFGPKNHNCQFKLKIGTRIWRIQYWCSFFSVFDRKCTFLEICSKNQNRLLKLRFKI